MSLILALVALLVPPAAVDGLRSTAPKLSDGAAREHLAAALISGIVAGESDVPLLLYIGVHESDLTANARTYEPLASKRAGHAMWSCGVMTPEPVERCPATMSVLDGYLAGARHLAVWRRASTSEAGMFLGYAGGYYLIRLCASGHAAPGDCRAPSVFRRGAEWIKRSIGGETSWTRTKQPST